MSKLLSELFRRLQNEAGEGGDPGAGAAPTVEVEATPTIPEGEANPFSDTANVDDWEGYDPIGTEEPAAPAEPVETPAAPAEPAPPKVPEPTPPTPPETPPAPQEPQAPQEQQPAAPDFDPVAFQERYAANLKESYQLSEAEAEAFNMDPVAALPQLAATVHQRVMNEVLTVITAALPAQIERYTQGTTREREAQQAFYGKWPQLKAYEKQVLQAGQMYNQMAPPDTPAEKRIEMIGRMVMTALGLPMEGEGQVQQPMTSQPSTPAPFVPAGQGPSGGARAPVTNIFGDLALSQDDD